MLYPAFSDCPGVNYGQGKKRQRKHRDFAEAPAHSRNKRVFIIDAKSLLFPLLFCNEVKKKNNNNHLIQFCSKSVFFDRLDNRN